jgi:hypothetical protein
MLAGSESGEGVAKVRHDAMRKLMFLSTVCE